MDKGKIIQLLKGYSTDSKKKLETSIDYDRIDDLADDLVKLFSLYIVSYQREQLLAFVKQLQEDNEFTEEITFQDVNKFLANNCS